MLVCLFCLKFLFAQESGRFKSKILMPEPLANEGTIFKEWSGDDPAYIQHKIEKFLEDPERFSYFLSWPLIEDPRVQERVEQMLSNSALKSETFYHLSHVVLISGNGPLIQRNIDRLLMRDPSLIGRLSPDDLSEAAPLVDATSRSRIQNLLHGFISYAAQQGDTKFIEEYLEVAGRKDEFISQLLASPDETQKRRVAEEVLRFQKKAKQPYDPESMSVIRNLAKKGEDQVEAIEALAEFWDPNNVDAMVELLHDQDPYIQTHARRQFSNIPVQDGRIAAILSQHLDDPAVVIHLARHGHAQAKEIFMRMMQDPELPFLEETETDSIGVNIFMSFMKVFRKGSEAVLIQHLQNPGFALSLKGEVLEALNAMKDLSIFPNLKKLIRSAILDENSFVYRAFMSPELLERLFAQDPEYETLAKIFHNNTRRYFGDTMNRQMRRMITGIEGEVNCFQENEQMGEEVSKTEPKIKPTHPAAPLEALASSLETMMPEMQVFANPKAYERQVKEVEDLAKKFLEITEQFYQRIPLKKEFHPLNWPREKDWIVTSTTEEMPAVVKDRVKEYRALQQALNPIRNQLQEGLSFKGTLREKRDHWQKVMTTIHQEQVGNVYMASVPIEQRFRKTASKFKPTETYFEPYVRGQVSEMRKVLQRTFTKNTLERLFQEP